MKMKKIIYTAIIVIGGILLIYIGNKVGLSFVKNEGSVSKVEIKPDEEEIETDGLLKQYPYSEDIDYVKQEYPKGYAMLKALDWNADTEIWENQNISQLMDTLSQLTVEEQPIATYSEVPLKELLENPLTFMGDAIWYNVVYLDKIEIVQKGDERAEKINGGKSFIILHTHLSEKEKILLFIMEPEAIEGGIDTWYPKEDIGTRVNISGWYVGNCDGHPVLCKQNLIGG